MFIEKYSSQITESVRFGDMGTSTGAMICCAHYLVNILPILGVTGFVSIISQYQIKLFWIGIVFNIAGIIYIARK